ncbi:MAG: type II toxin-antitoxin system VapC family toxin [Verrucomicrobiota bacterium]
MPALVDTNVIIDIVANDPTWGSWSDAAVHAQAADGVFINPTVYAEISAGATNISAVEAVISSLRLSFQETPKDALFLAGQAFRKYRLQGGAKTSPLADFFIGAHAMSLGYSIITRDVKRYQAYFPKVPLITP